MPDSLPYSPEELADLARKAGPDVNTIVLTGPDIADETTVEGVRKDLIDESYACHATVKALAAKGRDTGGLTDHEADLIETNVTAGDYAYLIAALLREIEEHHGADEALRLARMVDAVREAGIEVLEDANDDLDQRATAVAQ